MRQLITAESFYRFPSNGNAHREDTSFINPSSKLFGVADGNSAAYSPSHPPLIYPYGLTGGAMASSVFSWYGLQASSNVAIRYFVLTASAKVLWQHLSMHKSPIRGDDVGGASFSVCKLNDDTLNLIVAGDCFLVVKRSNRFEFWHGFDEAAFLTEQEDNMAGYAVCLEQTKTPEKPEGDKGLAWDMYYPNYQAKRLRCANKNIGYGGYASLNGDSALANCWVDESVVLEDDVLWVLLGSDGLLHADFRPENAGEFVETFSQGGIPAIIQWRDEKDYLPHIGRGEYPEASAVVLKFK